VSKDTIRLTVLTPRELHEVAKAKADAEDVTLSQLIRWWLRSWVRGDLPTPSPPESEQRDRK
jgi:hypothetical protein